MRRFLFFALFLFGLPCAKADMYCDGKNVETTEGQIRLARQWNRVFYEDFEGGLTKWAVENLDGRLEIACREGGKSGQCLWVGNRGARGDTAFETVLPPIAVKGGADYRFTVAWRANRSLENLSGFKGKYMNQLRWLGADGNLVGVTPFAFGTAHKQWQTMCLHGTIPVQATGLAIHFGFDAPNFEEAEFLEIDDVCLETLAVPQSFERLGSVLSRPLRVAGTDRRISWQADTPPGTNLKFQVAGAADQDGGPGVWSEPLGPDGTKGTYFTTPGALPPAHEGHPWVRYVADLETADAAKTPALKGVSIGNVTDGPWQGRDTEPPAVVDRSATRTGDATAPISFRLTDETGVDRRTVRMAVDDVDVTRRLVLADGRYTYSPPSALESSATSMFLRNWRVQNYEKALTIERAPARVPTGQPALHITREAGRTDSAFRIQSPPIPVEPGAKYRLSYWSRHSQDLRGAMQNERSYSGGVAWLGENDIPIGQRVPIDFGEANPTWHEDACEVIAPAGALSATISFGMDSPDIFGGAFIDIADATLDGPHPKRETLNLHRITVTASDFAGNALDRDWYLLIRPPRTQNVVTIRDDGMTLIDGKPFFPIGLYAVWKKPFNDDSFDKAFGDLKAAGFNTAHTYNSGRGADFLEFYAAAQRHGIKLYVASGGGANCMDVSSVLWDVAQEEAQPAVVAWYLADDTASHVSYTELRALTEAIHDIDPGHITVQADGVGEPPVSRYSRYANSTDGFLPELYPIRDDTDKGVPDIIADMTTIRNDLAAAGVRGKTIWAIVQYFQGWGWPRYPTRDELWAMSYLTLIHGAHGITWYTYGGHGNNHGVTDNPEVWKNICDLAGEISKLQDVLVERTGPQPAAPEILSGPAKDALGYPSISVLLKEHQGKKWLLAANSAKAEVRARLFIPEAKGAALVFENRRLATEGGSLCDSFGPYGVHVYCLDGETGK